MVNLLTDGAIAVRPDRRVSLPQLFAAMARGEVTEFPSLRAHQRAPWHMFLVQLAALALWRAGQRQLPQQSGAWAGMLRGLVPGYPGDAPWRLVAREPDLPAFLQTPDPGGLKWNAIETPDALDVLISARNHDVKRAVNRRATAEDWILALVSLQTMSGYGGNGKNGIARMNGGYASRPLVGLAPGRGGGDLSVDPSAWWARDVGRLLEQRAAGEGASRGTVGGPGALWCLDWPEGEQLDLASLDPWFIEVCRRVRLVEKDGRFVAFTSTSRAARIDARRRRGDTGDPWAPVHGKERKSLTVGEAGFDYPKLCELLFSGEWVLPVLAQRGEGEQGRDMVLVAEALSRGPGKTEGLQSRIVAMPPGTMLPPPSDTAGETRAQMEEIDIFQRALRYSLALAAAGGDSEAVQTKHFARAREAKGRLHDAADRMFFPCLRRRFEEEADARFEFLETLWSVTRREFAMALPGMRCPATKRARAHARAEGALANMVRRKFPELFEHGLKSPRV